MRYNVATKQSDDLSVPDRVYSTTLAGITRERLDRSPQNKNPSREGWGFASKLVAGTCNHLKLLFEAAA
jgi:hypothetical protein